MAVLILNSGRCSHGRCFFCGYGRIRGFEATEGNVLQAMDRFFAQLNEDHVKVFGSGSFLDERQIPKKARQHFASECRRLGVKRLTIESRPEYVTTNALEDFKGIHLTVAIGLESCDDTLLSRLQKGYTSGDFIKASKIIRAMGQSVRAYLLANTPYTTDIKKSLDESVEFALEHADTVVVINLLPHQSAPLSRLWLDGQWNYLTKPEFAQLTGKWASNPRVETDPETFRFVPNIPQDMRQEIAGVGEWFLTHPHFEVWQDYLVRWYEPPKDRTLVFLPCSHRKPYSESTTHRNIIAVLGRHDRRRFHEVMISNAGVIPREFEHMYPFANYDWDESLETDAIKSRYIQVTAERIKKYLTAHANQYNGVLCFLKHSSESYQSLKKACEELGIPLENLLTPETYEKVRNQPRPLQTNEALDDLDMGLAGHKG